MCRRPPRARIVNSLTARRPASISSGKAAISIGVAGPVRAIVAIEAGSSNRTACAVSRSLESAARPGAVARSSTSERLEVLRNWNSALSDPSPRSGGARRTGSPPGGSILSTVAPRSAAILPASETASRRHNGTSLSFTSTIVKRCSGKVSEALIGGIPRTVPEYFGQSHTPCYRQANGGFYGADRQSQGPDIRHLSRTVPSGGRESHAVDGARHGAGGVDRRARLRRGLDRRASFGGMGDHRLARDLHRRRDRAHAL